MSNQRSAIIRTNKQEEIIIDEEDFSFLNRFIWRVDARGYAVTSVNFSGKYSCLSMHRLILCFPKKLVDHINRNKIDNRKQNLRLANHSQNVINSATRKSNAPYRGVRKSRTSWRARICINKVPKSLGSFSTAEAAARAYDAAALKYHGEFATLNFVMGDGE